MGTKKLGVVAVVYLGIVATAGCSSDDSAQPPSGDDGGSFTQDASTGDATMGGTDSGTDAGHPDSGTDAGGSTDAGHDAAGDAADGAVSDSGHDASSGDAGSDSGSDAGVDASGADAAADSGDAGTGEAGDAAADAGDAAPADGGDGGMLVAPIGKWSFEEGTGTTAADLSGNGHPATLKGAATWTTSGKVGSGLLLDGTNGYADVGVTLVDTTKAFTVSAWVSLNAVSTWAVAVSEDDVNGSLFGLKLRGDGSNAFDFDVETSDIMSPGFAVAQSTTTAQTKTWTHLTGVYDPAAASGSGAVTVYVNGAPEAKTTVGQALAAATGHFLIGRGLYNGATGSFVNGTLDEVEVRNVALTDAQVAALYAATK